jgi:hypothetical protein
MSRIPYQHSIQIHCNGVFAQGPEDVTTCNCELLPMYGVTRYTRALLLRTYYGIHQGRLEPVAKPDIPASRLPSTGEEVRSASVVVGISTRSSIKLIHCSALLHTCLPNKLDAKRGPGTGSALCKDRRASNPAIRRVLYWLMRIEVRLRPRRLRAQDLRSTTTTSIHSCTC